MSIPAAEELLPPKLSRRWHYAREQAISFLMQQAVENPDVISLAAGLVDSETLPVEETRAAVQKVLADHGSGKMALQYGTTAGSERLRRLLLAHFSQLEGRDPHALGVDAGQLVVTTGSQQLLSLVCEILLDPGDICLVAGPTYFVFVGNLNGVGVETVTIPSDDGGMQTDALETALQTIESEGRLDRVKLIYTVSYYDNPSGRSLSTDRRQQIVDIAHRWSKHHRLFVLEDAAYRELRYDGETLPSVWSFDESRQTVIYTQTFSKSYSPGLRIGFGVLPRDLVKPLCDRKGNEDFGSANFNQHILATVLESGLYDSHVEQVCAAYRIKRDAMLAAADRWFADLPGVSWVHPHGGLYVWMSLPPRVQTGFESELFGRAVAEGVMYVPGELCYASPLAERPRNEMRLSYGVQPPEGIEEGMRRLSVAVGAMLEHC
ncbi:MAG: PLP-dependent aminotransferase family protein [Maioricimonas sp. JB049]